jgi:hypothetical protein
MKKTLLTIITLFSLFLTLSCSQEIQFRESVIQASVNGQLWLTDEVRVYVLTEKFGGKDVPYYFIEGVKDNQTLTLRTTGLAKSTYPLGNNNSKTAHLINIGETGILEFKNWHSLSGQ